MDGCALYELKSVGTGTSQQVRFSTVCVVFAPSYIEPAVTHRSNNESTSCFFFYGQDAVSYTHLDVYKRQDKITVF